MLFFKKKKLEPDFEKLYKNIKSKFNIEVSNDIKTDLTNIIDKNGYYPSSFQNLNLSESEVLFCLDKIIEGDKELTEAYDIKIINLSGLSGMMDWLKELIIIPQDTIIYLTPFHKRDFNNSYLIKDMDVDENLKDKNFDLTPKEQIQLFINLAQKSGHKVIYDFLFRTSRYSKTVTEKPYLARWIDTKSTEIEISSKIDKVIEDLETKYDKDDIKIVKNIYEQESKGNLSEEYNKLYKIFEKRVFEEKKKLSEKNYNYAHQLKLQKQVAGKSVEELIQEGLWTVPCGADNEFGLPVFDYMNKEENYPIFKHFDKDGNDISQMVRDDFQTPAYFMTLDKNEINKNVLKYFIDMAKNYITEFKFNGLNINYTQDIFENNFNDKIPVKFLKTFIEEIKKEKILILAEGDFEHLKQYQNLGVDILWIKDIHDIPSKIISKYEKLTNYNTEDLKIKNLELVKIYNDRFGETSHINKYPSKLGYKGAMFKWFCINFLPSGRHAKFLKVYLDGDESYTEKGFAKTLFEQTKLKRNNDEKFYKEFRAITDFARNYKLIRDGEATIIDENDDGFVSWLISKEPLKEMVLVVANYKPAEENLILQNDNEKIITKKENEAVVNKMISIPGECKIVCEYIFDGEKYIQKECKTNSDLLEIEVLKPSEYRIFLLRK